MHARALTATFAACATLITTTALLTIAGPLSPPAGPVISTYRTLTEVEPRVPLTAATTPGDADSVFRISQSGSYYLTGNVTVPSAKNGVEIAAANVTLDLMGFTIRGLSGSFDGITASAAPSGRFAVRNGAVTGPGGDGVDLDRPAGGDGILVEGVDASGCGDAGIVAGDNAVISRCTARGNAGIGISIALGGVVDRCTASGNATGISVGAGSTVTASSALANDATGIAGSSGVVITACAAYDNAGAGFTLSVGGTITDSAARTNGTAGIRVSAGCLVRSNTCYANSTSGDGANIHVISIDNRIESNNCSGAFRGIDVDGFGNFIARNTSSGAVNANYAIAAGNICLVVAANPTAVAINGSSGGTSPGSANPDVNYSY